MSVMFCAFSHMWSDCGSCTLSFMFCIFSMMFSAICCALPLHILCCIVLALISIIGVLLCQRVYVSVALFRFHLYVTCGCSMFACFVILRFSSAHPLGFPCFSSICWSSHWILSSCDMSWSCSMYM